MFVPLPGFENIDLTGYTCILPDVSLGNVAQLSLDLLINTLDCFQIGSMSHKSIVPMIGRNAFSKQLMTGNWPSTALDVFVNEENKLLLVQIRSSIVRRHCDLFVKELFDWLHGLKVIRLLMLSSLDAIERKDREIMSPNSCYFLQIINKSNESSRVIDLQNAMKEKGVRSFQAEQQILQCKEDLMQLNLSGSGFLQNVLLGSFNNCSEFTADIFSVFLYCMEGDNRPHGKQLAALIYSIFVHKQNDTSFILREPISWCVFDETYDSHASIF